MGVGGTPASKLTSHDVLFCLKAVFTKLYALPKIPKLTKFLNIFFIKKEEKKKERKKEKKKERNQIES